MQIPWRYNATAFVNVQEVSMESRPTVIARLDVSNIARASGMTCSGRFFSPAPLQKVAVEEVDKERGIEVLRPH